MKNVTDEDLREADHRVHRAEGSLRVDMEAAGLTERQQEALIRSAKSYGTAVADLCIKVERMAEKEGWHQ